MELIVLVVRVEGWQEISFIYTCLAPHPRTWTPVYLWCLKYYLNHYHYQVCCQWPIVCLEPSYTSANSKKNKSFIFVVNDWRPSSHQRNGTCLLQGSISCVCVSVQSTEAKGLWKLKFIYTSPLLYLPNQELVFPVSLMYNPTFYFKVSYTSTNSKQSHSFLIIQTERTLFPFNHLQTVAKTEACLLLHSHLLRLESIVIRNSLLWRAAYSPLHSHILKSESSLPVCSI